MPRKGVQLGSQGMRDVPLCKKLFAEQECMGCCQTKNPKDIPRAGLSAAGSWDLDVPLKFKRYNNDKILKMLNP